MMYEIEKYKISTGERVAYYGEYNYEDMKLITRGYKQDDFIDEIYSREGSDYMFIVAKK